LRTDPSFAAMLTAEEEPAAKVEEFLARKADGRPLSPEEYDYMTKFVDRVEKKATSKTAEQKLAEEAQLAEIRKLVPASAFEKSILDSGLPEHVGFILQEAGYFSLGDMAVQMKLDQDQILRLQGIGERALGNITTIMTALEEQLVADQEAALLKAQEPQPEVVLEPEVTPAVEEVTPVEELVESEVAIVEAVEETPAAVVEEEEEISLAEIFTLRPEVLDTAAMVTDEEESDESDKKKGKKKKSKHVVITYDEDRDATTVTKQHKRGEAGWEWEE